MATIHTLFGASALPSSLAHDCQHAELQPVEHPENVIDWSDAWSSQGYQVRRCDSCGDYWGVRFQYDSGTGHGDHLLRFGPDPRSVKRHKW